jgi:hypothetical protein
MKLAIFFYTCPFVADLKNQSSMLVPSVQKLVKSLVNQSKRVNATNIQKTIELLFPLPKKNLKI